MNFTVTLTEEQLERLLCLIDMHTKEAEPDWFLHSDGTIGTPALKDGKPIPRRSVQEHLDLILEEVEL